MVRVHYIPIGMTKIQKTNGTRCSWACGVMETLQNMGDNALPKEYVLLYIKKNLLKATKKIFANNKLSRKVGGKQCALINIAF